MKAASLRFLSIALATIALSVAHPASACWTSDHALVHSTLPPVLPVGAVVLDVDIDTSNPSRLYSSGLPARVLSVRYGDVQATSIVLRTPYGTTCDNLFANGSTGIIIGFWTGGGDDRAISPVFVTEEEGFSLHGPVQPRTLPR